MAMALRVVVPPHPLIGHWLAVLRDRHTPGPLYASATTELGRWLSYEALRDWLPHRSFSVCITGRVTLSLPPPGAVPTMTRIGLDG